MEELVENEEAINEIYKVLNLGYHCEVDIWKKDGAFYLGHDEPMYEIDSNLCFFSLFFITWLSACITPDTHINSTVKFLIYPCLSAQITCMDAYYCKNAF